MMPPSSSKVAYAESSAVQSYGFPASSQRRGMWVAPVDYPAVPRNRICFRACFTALHTRADLDEALNILEDTLVPNLVAQHA